MLADFFQGQIFLTIRGSEMYLYVLVSAVRFPIHPFVEGVINCLGVSKMYQFQNSGRCVGVTSSIKSRGVVMPLGTFMLIDC
jgi:hypothetical protein